VRRLYSFRDLVALKVISSLLDRGMSLQRVRTAYDYLRKKAELDNHLSEVKLVTDGKSIYQMYRNDQELEDLLREGQMAFYLAIDDATESDGGRNIGHLYERERFVTTLREAESELERSLPQESRTRLWASR
jgi:DNA-binding transcriptional MerR regulator